jgi:hypothetical protein
LDARFYGHVIFLILCFEYFAGDVEEGVIRWVQTVAPNDGGDQEVPAFSR